MDTIPELIELGYSSKLKRITLLNWIKNNNYLSNLQTEYFLFRYELYGGVNFF
jgi:hypothetical protein